MRSNIILDFKNGRDGLQHPTCEYFKEGYDLDKASGTSLLQDLLQDRKPKHVWVSLKCTRLSSLNNQPSRSDRPEISNEHKKLLVHWTSLSPTVMTLAGNGQVALPKVGTPGQFNDFNDLPTSTIDISFGATFMDAPMDLNTIASQCKRAGLW